MKGREEMEQLLVGYLYGELSEAERIRVEEELERDPEWAAVLDDLRSTVGVLRKWENVEPPVRNVIAPAPAAPAADARRSARRPVRWRSFAPAAAGVAAALLLIGLKADMTVDNGRFQIAFGGTPEPVLSEQAAESVPLELEAGAPFVTEDYFLRSQAELVRFVATLIRESEDRQSEQFVNAFTGYAAQLEQDREGDLLLLDQRLGFIEDGTQDILERVNSDFPVSTVTAEGRSSR